MIRIDDIIDTYLKGNPEGDELLIQKAYIYSAAQHEGQLRKSGEPYMTHPLNVAKIVTRMGLDEASICAALLHDTIEDTSTTREILAEMFAEDIANLVDGVTKLSKVQLKKREDRQAESFHKLLVAMAKDIRVLLIKLADRLHNMKTLKHMESESQIRIAGETGDIYAPLADRLGISWLKAELEDTTFEYLEPENYKSLTKKINHTKSARNEYIKTTISKIKDILAENNFSGDVYGRLKNLNSVHKKMVTKNIEYEDVHDAIAFRIICASVNDCYGILGILHSKWTPVPGRFKDFIAIPKPNQYQSLHTTVIGIAGHMVEIQIRTHEMHKIAESGIAAHWAYKENKSFDSSFEGFAWLRELLESHQETRNSQEFLDSVKVNLFKDEVFVFTPNGDVKSLQKGASALDFAYSIHTDIGQTCTGARVNSVQVPIRTKIRNGDMVEITTSKNQKPSSDWLNFVVTGKAGNKIRSYLRAQERNQTIKIGQELLEKALRTYECSFAKIEKSGAMDKTADALKCGNKNGLLKAIGSGNIEPQRVVEMLLPDEKRSYPPASYKEGTFEKVIRKVRKKPDGIVLDGVENLLTKFANCCNPLPGEEITGYISHGRGIIIHKKKCVQAAILDPDRKTTVSWSKKALTQRPVKIRVKTNNQPGILSALTQVFSKMNINLHSAHCDTSEGDEGEHIFAFDTEGINELNHILRSIKKLKQVLSVERIP